MSISIDGLTADELKALDAHEQLAALSDICGDVKRLSDEKKREIDKKFDAKIALVLSPTDAQRKVALLEATRRIDKLNCEISMRKQQQQNLQTQINIQMKMAG